MRFTILIFSILSCFQSRSQQKAVDILTNQKEDNITFNVINLTDTRQEVTLEIDTVNLSGYEKPIKKLVSAKDTVSFTTLSFVKSKRWEYATNYTYRPKPTENEIKVENERSRKELLQSLDHSTSGITVFVTEGCKRSEYVTKYMKRKKIQFKSLETSSNDLYNRGMWQSLRFEEPSIETVQFPVFLIGDHIDYNITDLKQYTTNLSR